MKVSLKNATELLLNGSVVAIPTETVYGLAAWLGKESAIEKIFQLKKRSSSNPLIIHVKNVEECLHYVATIPDDFQKLTSAFWPGPLTVVLPIQEEKIPSIARAGLQTAAFRMPNHPVTLAVLESVSPLVAPSANLSGTPSSTKLQHIENDFGSDFPALDGLCTHGLESTILAQKNGKWEIARLGAISQEAIAKVLGYIPKNNEKTSESPICPGQLLSHYAPKARLILSDQPYKREENPPVVLGFTDRDYSEAKKVFFFGPITNPEEVAHNLYAQLRQLDIEDIQEAWVDIAIPSRGIWATIRERLFRASASQFSNQLGLLFFPSKDH